MDSNPRRLQLRVTLTAALLVVPGHRAPPPDARCSVLALWSSSTAAEIQVGASTASAARAWGVLVPPRYKPPAA